LTRNRNDRPGVKNLTGPFPPPETFLLHKGFPVSLISKFLLALSLCIVSASAGCNRKPDPRDNPDFNNEALEDPGKIKMDKI
jgi:hypothetical protein